jgi:hypothetical protein
MKWEGSKMTSTADRLRLYETILALIDEKRTESGDQSLGDSIERVVIESQFRELEREIFDNPGPIEPWLIRLRRGEV